MEIRNLKTANNYIYITIICFLCLTCKNNSKNYDATGLFESDEIVVSSELSGKLQIGRAHV